MQYGIFLKGLTKHVSKMSYIFTFIACVNIIFLFGIHFRTIGKVDSCCNNYFLKLTNQTLSEMEIITPEGAEARIDATLKNGSLYGDEFVFPKNES